MRGVWSSVALLGAVLACSAWRAAWAGDCNRNGIEDAVEVTLPALEFRLAGALDLESPPDAIATGDLDDDGDLDMALPSNALNEVLLLDNRGEGAFELRPPLSLSGRPRSLVTSDLDGDGGLDIAVATDFEVLLLLNHGAWMFGPETSLPVGSDPFVVRSGDLDGDGDRDLVTANFIPGNSLDDNISVLLNRGDGSFAPARNFAAHRGFPLLEIADLDGDGDLDLVVVGIGSFGTGSLVILENLGGGQLLRAPAADIPRGITGALALGDVDGDDRIDVVLSNPSGLELLLNAGGLRFELSSALLVPGSGENLRVMDVEGDQDIDIVVPRGGCPDFTVLQNGGAARFTDRLSVDANLGTRLLAAGDFNGDGATDFVGVTFRGSSSGGIAVFLRQASGPYRDCNANDVPDECEADCNESGSPDDCDIAGGTSSDCNGDGVPDECEADCDANGVPDACELQEDGSLDCDRNGVPDSCELALGDCDANGVLDDCDLRVEPGRDCDRNGVLDCCEVSPRFALSEEEYAVAAEPAAVIAADLDGDGVLELAVANRGSHQVKLLQGTPDGGFVPARSYRFDTEVDRIAAADLDGDGAPDLVVGGWHRLCPGSRSWLRVLINRGGMELTRRASYAVDGDLNDIEQGDLDGDGVTDLVVGAGRKVLIQRGNGDGTFVLPMAVAESQNHFGTFIALGDLDLDGDVDMATNAGQVLINRGDGSFAPASTPLPLSGTWIIEAGDFDDDADLDLAIAGPKVSLLINQGSGAFIPGPQLGAWLRSDLLAADFDADSNLDLAVADSWDTVTLFRNLGGLRFDAGARYGAGADVEDLAAGDVNGDGRLDLITANFRSASVSVLRNVGDGSFSTRTIYTQGRSPEAFVAEDLDGDGDRDLAVLECCPAPSRLLVFDNDGKGSFPTYRSFELEALSDIFTAGDLNGDGSVDLVFSKRGKDSEVFVALNRGDGTFRTGARLAAGNDPSQIQAADIDGDRDLDLVGLQIGSPSGLFILLSRGDATFGEPAILPVEEGHVSFLVADIDGDGDGDLIFPTLGEVLLWRNSGGVTFAKESALEVQEPLWAIAAEDLDGDGDLDLALGSFDNDCNSATSNCGATIVAFNAGDGRFEKVAVYRFPGFPNEVAASDLDGDGDADLVVAEGRFGASEFAVGYSVLLNDGSGGFRAGGRFIAGRYDLRSLRLADLNGDGYPEFVGLGGLGLQVLTNRTEPPRARDLDRDGIIDTCGGLEFRRADVNQDGAANVTDAVVLLSRLFLNGGALECEKAADLDDDGKLNLTDALRLLNYLIGDGPPLPEPFTACGRDPTPDTLACPRFSPCRG